MPIVDAKPRRRTAPRGDGAAATSPGAACTAASILALLVVVVVMLSSPSRRAAGNPPPTPLSLPSSAHTRADAATLLHDAQTMLSFLKRHTGPLRAEAPPKQPQPEQHPSPPAIPPPPPPPPTPTARAPAQAQAATPPKDPWLARLADKLACAQQRRGAVYLYHVRKAAGTTVRDVLTTATARWGVPLHETEGVTMHPSAVAVPGLLTVLTLRDPIARVFSMFWYEHVGWYDGILHETQRCKPLATWVDAWLDGSPWKTAFMRKNPSNVYVEVENYYVKMLSGWAGPGPVGEADYNAAVAALERVDVVLITEWMKDNTSPQAQALQRILSPPGAASTTSRTTTTATAASGLAVGHQLRGDASVQQRLGATLAKGRDDVERRLRAANAWDLKLWAHAQALAKERWATLLAAAPAATAGGTCDAATTPVLPPAVAKTVGLFRPPGHKGPLDTLP